MFIHAAPIPLRALLGKKSASHSTPQQSQAAGGAVTCSPTHAYPMIKKDLVFSRTPLDEHSTHHSTTLSTLNNHKRGRASYPDRGYKAMDNKDRAATLVVGAIAGAVALSLYNKTARSAAKSSAASLNSSSTPAAAARKVSDRSIFLNAYAR